VSGRLPLARLNFWHRADLHFAGALLLGAALPFSIAAAIEPRLLGLHLYFVSLGGSIVAITTGSWLFRNLIAFPGIRASYYVLPVFLSTFAAIFAAFLLTRAQYSRPLLVASLGLAVGWHYLVYVMVQRRQRLAIAVVPFGRTDSLLSIENVIWTRLDRPTLPPGFAMLAADFDQDLAPEWEKLLAECALAGVPVLHYKQLRQSLTGQVQMERLSENAFGSLMPNTTYLAVKRIADLVIAALLLPVLLPLLLLIALLVRIDSRGPAFFRQVRIGYRGEPFLLWKFRTMRESPSIEQIEKDHARQSAMTRCNDRRITRIGHILRRTRIDELPQIINILRGEMSWIGPRPEAVVLSQWYEKEIPFYRYRHIVRPGVSGWAQVHQGHVTELGDITTKLSYDFFYISRFTFWIDMLILARTVKTLFTGFGSR
jgi:lipopolysaccharide/colanic/teichoic acid biosynthesis glycosyltransferase